MIRYLLNLLLFFSCHICVAQQDTIKTRLKWYGYIDLYYLYNFNNPSNDSMPAFMYNHNRHNEIALNQAILGVKISEENYRAALAFHSGTYVTANYAGESQPLLRNIYEANIGYKLKEKLWLEAGIFSSYIGCETPISFENWALTRPVMVENYPYYQSGVKVSYEPSEKWFFSGLVLNGWQTISESNKNKPLGAQIQYKPNSKVLLNTSLFWGKEKAAIDTLTAIANRRGFFDFYGIFQLTGKVSAALYCDLGRQRISSIHKEVTWYGLLGMLRYKPSKKTAFCLRGEHFHDSYGVMVLTHTRPGFQTTEVSLNVDYYFSEHILARLQGTTFITGQNKSADDTLLIEKSSYMMVGSLSFKF